MLLSERENDMGMARLGCGQDNCNIDVFGLLTNDRLGIAK